MIVKNNVILKFLFVILILFDLIGFPPSVGVLLSLINQHNDILINSKNYIKKEVVIDSLIFEDLDGTNYEDVSGFSKQLNNYKTEILLGSVRDDFVNYDLGFDSKGKLIKNVWFHNNHKYAYISEEKQELFPVREFIFKKVKLPLLWIILIILTIFIQKQVKFNNQSKSTNEKNN